MLRVLNFAAYSEFMLKIISFRGITSFRYLVPYSFFCVRYYNNTKIYKSVVNYNMSNEEILNKKYIKVTSYTEQLARIRRLASNKLDYRKLLSQ